MRKRIYLLTWIVIAGLCVGCGKREDMPAEKTAAETDENNAAFEQEASAEPRYIEIDLSETEEMHREGDTVAPLELRVISEEENGIDEADGWYDRNQLSLPMIGDS